MNNNSIIIDSHGFMADTVLRSCSPEAIGVLFMLITVAPSGKLQLCGNEEYIKRLRRFQPRARLRSLNEALSEIYPTWKPTHTVNGLFELYDRGIITVVNATVSIVPEHHYVRNVE